MKIYLIGILLMVLASCTMNQKDATKVLSGQGYKHMEYTGYQWFACSDKDYFNIGFVALGLNGSSVTGVVCRGIWKGKTVRILN